MEIFFRTFFMVLLMEIGSASNFTLAAVSAHSTKPFLVWVAGMLALASTCFLAVKFGSLVNRLPISSDLLSGLILTIMGLFFLWRAKA